ncbi:spore coat protein [bacterium]|nr:spore coat protein [bacterium]|tara:strand:+ start:203 stop:943 length:741 start_codon:yes stop_codon:yes gene_type:complete
MKGIILAGGLGTRLLPCTKITNKHLIPVFNKPMIYYSIYSLISAGIKSIMIISGKGHAGQFLELLGSGQKFGAKFSYEVQEEPGGIAQALGLAEDFADQGRVVVMLGDNIIEQDIKPCLRDFREQEKGGKIFLKRVKNPQSYGVAQIEKGIIKNIIEKPKKPKSNLAVIGLYMYDEQVWDILKTLKPSKRGELEITDVNNFYVKQKTMTHEILKGFWGDCGESFESLLEASKKVARNEKLREIFLK